MKVKLVHDLVKRKKKNQYLKPWLSHSTGKLVMELMVVEVMMENTDPVSLAPLGLHPPQCLAQSGGPPGMYRVKYAPAFWHRVGAHQACIK